MQNPINSWLHPPFLAWSISVILSQRFLRFFEAEVRSVVIWPGHKHGPREVRHLTRRTRTIFLFCQSLWIIILLYLRLLLGNAFQYLCRRPLTFFWQHKLLQRPFSRVYPDNERVSVTGVLDPFQILRGQRRGTPKRQDDFLSLSLLRLEDVSQGWNLLASIALTAEAVCAVRRNWLLPPPPTSQSSIETSALIFPSLKWKLEIRLLHYRFDIYLQSMF